MPHIHQAIDLTVAAFIVHNKQVLMVNHRQLKKWLPIGGHVELNQDPQEALFNEIKEESGLTRENLTVYSSKPQIESLGTKFLYTPNYLDIHDISPSHRHIGMIYFLGSNTSKIVLAEREHSEIRWFSAKDIADPKYNLFPATSFYASQALKKAEEAASPL